MLMIDFVFMILMMEEYQPMPNENNIDNNFKDDEEYGLDIFYDSTLDDGPILLEDPPYLELVTNLWDDKDDMLVVCDNTLTHESPTLFFHSPIYTIEEQFLYVEKYLCGLKLYCTNNHSTHNHHVSQKWNLDLRFYVSNIQVLSHISLVQSFLI
jgi:hypothetical protein